MFRAAFRPFPDGLSRGLFVVLALALAFAYTLVLPFDFTRRLSLANWRYLDAGTVLFALAFAVVLAAIAVAQLQAFRAGGRLGRRRVALLLLPASAAALASIAPSLLCCGTIWPTLASRLGISSGTSLQVQYLFAAKQDLFLGGSLFVLTAVAVCSFASLAREGRGGTPLPVAGRPAAPAPPGRIAALTAGAWPLPGGSTVKLGQLANPPTVTQRDDAR